MPLFKTIPITDGLISIWQITESAGELLSLFSPEELDDENFRMFTFDKRKAEWLATRALLKHMIGPEFKITYTQSGKPLLQNTDYQHISISHSREFVAIYIHKNKNIGIDIESTNRNYTPILKKYLSENELIQVNNSTLLQCLYWCAKEALFKMVEEDGIDFKKQFEILAVDSCQGFLSARYHIPGEKEINYQLHYITTNDHCMAWVINDPVNDKGIY